MTKENDISTLFSGIGIESNSYKELAAERQLDESLSKWSLLATVHRNRAGQSLPPRRIHKHNAPVEQKPAPVTVPSSIAPASSATSVFQRISQPQEELVRVEPVISAASWELESKDVVDKAQNENVQALFARLEGKSESIAPQSEASPQTAKQTLFQRLLNQ